MKTTTVLSVIALTCSCASAFTVSPSIRNVRSQASTRSSARCTTMMGSREDSFIPSETWFGEYMGEQGLRYALNKTPQEIDSEGDYTLIEKLFGQTSNNKKRMELKKEVLAKADIPTNPEQYKSWTAKYGYGRFFPVYVDKSGNGDDSPAPATPQPSMIAAAPKAQATPAAPVAKKASSVKVMAKKAPAPKAAAAPKVAPKPKPAPKKVAPVKPKPMGNMNNLPKAL